MITVVYITFPNRDTARKICDQLLEKRLVACANIYAMDSAYHWQSEIARESEWVAVCKTSPARIDQLTTEVENSHPYQVPCIVHWPAQANQSYERWVYNEVDVQL